ncbi:MAG: LPS export ABC transporter periplasmic protein LptC [Candidatus Sulfotelmatobacter sp.]
MPLPIYRLRRWLAVIAVLFCILIAGMYFYARMRARNVLKELPNKIGIDIKQTANGFQFSKSDGKRTLFTIEASNLKQFQLNGRAELHNVSIVLYGRDSSRFDRIYGDDFTYDKQSGNVSAQGDVQIDLEANPAGRTGPDQGTPKELKNPIHLKTTNLVFNQTSGDATTDARVDFHTPQATGWAVGMQYSGKSNSLTLASQIHVTLGGEGAATLFATHGVINRTPRGIVLEHARMERTGGTLQADEATFFLGPDNDVQHVIATGNVNAKSSARDSEEMRARADVAELLLTDKKNLLRTATVTGNVHVERIGSQPMQGDAGRAILDFRGQNELQKVHAMDGVRLEQNNSVANSNAAGSPSEHSSQAPQDFDIASQVIDFFVVDGRRLNRAQTSGAAQITISLAQDSMPASTQAAQRTVISAGRFEAKFAETSEGTSRLTSVHGAPNAKIVSIAPGMPNRISTSQTLDAAFLPEGGISSVVQKGQFVYDDGQPAAKRTQAWAQNAAYTPADQILVLNGSPRVAEGTMVTTATTVRINRVSDDAFAEGNVKSTYRELTEQPNGALLASASPIHVTAASMTAHNSPAVAIYQGNGRLWQDANIIEAPTIQFDRDQRFLIAQGTAGQPVSTVLVQGKPSEPGMPQLKSADAEPRRAGQANKTPKSAEKSTDASPIAISAARLTYSDKDRTAHYEGGVTAKGTSFSVTAATMDAYLRPRIQTSINQQVAGLGQLDHMIAQGNIVIQQPSRRAEGQQLLYTASDDKFVLTGGPPSIFDAERGKITGVSLTFFRGDDRVLVEGEASTPVVTQTRVAK